MKKNGIANNRKSWITYSPEDGEYGMHDIILTNFNTDHPDYDSVKQVCKELKMQIWILRKSHDIVAFPHFLLILDPDMFTTEESDILVDIIKLYDVKEYSILFTKEPSYIINPKLRKYIVRQRNVFNYDNLKLLVLNRRSKAIRHNHQHVPNDKKLFRVTNIYFRLLSKEPNITTQVLCDDFGVSAKTIHRDIDMLIQFGNEISYDKQLKSWVMGHSIYKIDFEFEYAKKELEKEKR